ncbi:hypothetical protein ACFX15_027722 [Malus domestica]
MFFFLFFFAGRFRLAQNKVFFFSSCAHGPRNRSPLRLGLQGTRTPQQRWVSELNRGDAGVTSGNCPQGSRVRQNLWVQRVTQMRIEIDEISSCYQKPYEANWDFKEISTRFEKIFGHKTPWTICRSFKEARHDDGLVATPAGCRG